MQSFREQLADEDNPVDATKVMNWEVHHKTDFSVYGLQLAKFNFFSFKARFSYRYITMNNKIIR